MSYLDSLVKLLKLLIVYYLLLNIHVIIIENLDELHEGWKFYA